MYSVKDKERLEYGYSNENGYNSNNANGNANNRVEREFDMSNNVYDRQSNFRNDNRYDSAGSMRNSSYSPRNNNESKPRVSGSGEYSSLNRYYGVPKVVNDIDKNQEKSNRVVAQNQNTTTSAMKNNRATQISDYEIYNEKPKVAKKKLSLRKKICIIVVCVVVALSLILTVANIIPNANAQGNEQARQEVTVDKKVGQVVDESGSINDVNLVQSGSGYNYDTKTNWFDGFCDWIENLVG